MKKGALVRVLASACMGLERDCRVNAKSFCSKLSEGKEKTNQKEHHKEKQHNVRTFCFL